MKKDAYDESNKLIDYQINKYTLKCIKTMLVVLVMVWILNYFHVFIINMELLSKSVIVTFLILIITLIFGRLVDLHKSFVKYFLITLTIVAITVLQVTLTYHTLLLSMIPLLISVQYTNKRVLLYTYFLIVISIFISVIGGYFWGLCDANMLLLTTETTNFYRNMNSSDIKLGNINTNPCYKLILYFVIPRCISLSLTIPVIKSISKNIKKHEEYAVSMKHQSEIDDMTGLFNRNKFLSMICERYIKMDKLCVIFFDVNNLKRINDTLGHEKGDYLIVRVAKMIKMLTDTNKKGYRIGGDEFIIIVEDPKEGEVEALLKKWKELVALKSKIMKTDLSVAIGYSYGQGIDIEKIVKEADERMYEKKREQKNII